MSLKAKLEAVIYAAEEPVTLAQFASLFAEEALAWKADREAQSRESAAESSETVEPSDSSRELADLLVVVGDTSEEILRGDAIAAEPASAPEAPGVESAADTAAEASAQPSDSAVREPEISSASPVETPSGEEALVEQAATPAPDPEAEAKRAQRLREREVREILRGILDELIAEYAADSRGIEIREIAGGFRMGTKPEIHDAVRAFVKSLKPPMKLSLPALETLAVIAYKQPVTAPEVGEIRGVDSAGVLGSLMSRKLIATAGRKQVIGRPMLYKTTKEFLLRFGLKDLSELPSMEEFEKMAAMELSESDEPEPDNLSGDLFAQPEAHSSTQMEEAGQEEVGSGKTGLDEAGLEENGPELPVAEVPEASTPAAEASEEAAAAEAPVERLDAEEIEASR